MDLVILARGLALLNVDETPVDKVSLDNVFCHLQHELAVTEVPCMQDSCNANHILAMLLHSSIVSPL